MENLGPYKLQTVLGRGGMGTVYKALNTESNETLAVKVLAPVYSADDHFRNRFESEIKALLKLDHPNIVRLVGYGQDDNNLYFAMELVEGKSLYQLQRDGKPFHWREVMRIAKNIALGLRHAHDRGVIHRDMKPGNLLRADTGIIKITDFGIAKSFGQTQNTGTNVLGTVDFMSPEQAKGQQVTAKSDLYSLGTVMYTLLSGRPPFTSNSIDESMRNLTKVPAPRISRQAPDVPEQLDELIAQLLEKDPEKRVPTALSLYHQLKQAEQSLLNSSQAATASHPRNIASDITSVEVEPSTSIEQHRGAAYTIRKESSSSSHKTSVEGGVAPGTVSARQTGPNLKKAQAEDEDYFTAVTEDERLEHLDPTVEEVEETSSVGTYLLAGLLALVLGAVAYGVVMANRKPTAESLIAKIEESWDQPQKRIGEISDFLEYYQDHEKYDAVKERERFALAFQKVHYLRRTRTSATQLTPLESNFLSIVNLSAEDAPQAIGQLEALIALHKNDNTLQPRDSECVEAAIAYRVPIGKSAADQKVKVRSEIESQLKRAENLPTNEARAVYDSIVELNQKYLWVADLVEKAKSKSESLE